LSLEILADKFQDLAAPLLQKLGIHWETTFKRKIPAALDLYANTCQAHQEYIQSLIKAGMRERTALSSIIGILEEQDKARINGLNNMVDSLKSDIRTSQREANRDFMVAIQRKLKPEYEACSRDRGT
jgi:hypothetical protein